MLTFFSLKDGPSFLPWLRTWVGKGFGRHTAEVTGRVWTALGHYVWSQAAVAAVDAILIGLFVAIFGLPYALPIAVLTFFGGFIPIVGATVAGGVATLVGLVSGGIWVAAAVLGWVIVVQNVEGNILQPLLVGRTLRIHPAIILLAVTLGGTLYGIVGALLAAPTVATIQVIAHYAREQLTAVAAAPSGDADATTVRKERRTNHGHHRAGHRGFRPRRPGRPAMSVTLPIPTPWPGMPDVGIDAPALESMLRERVNGEVRFDPGSRAAYSTDASNFRQTPIGVIAPRTVDAAVQAIAVCREFGAPVLSRGGGTSLAGQCCNTAVVLDWSKYCDA